MLSKYHAIRKMLKTPPIAAVAIVLWTVAIGAGWASMLNYEFQVSTHAPQNMGQWPAGTIERAPERMALVVCLHPKCPCSQATIAELERLLARPAVVGSAPEVITLLPLPDDADDSWTTSTLVRRCRKIPAVRVVFDQGGMISARFGAETSGTVLAFDSQGLCLFFGGLTASRGHEGASCGTDALEALLAGSPHETSATPVFGCRLVSPRPTDAPRTQPSSHPTTTIPPLADRAQRWASAISADGALEQVPGASPLRDERQGKAEL